MTEKEPTANPTIHKFNSKEFAAVWSNRGLSASFFGIIIGGALGVKDGRDTAAKALDKMEIKLTGEEVPCHWLIRIE